MAIYVTNGAQVAFASAYGTAVTISAFTNGTAPVATLGASHGVVAGDFLEVNSGWELVNSRIFRALSVGTGTGTNDVTIEGLNTVSTSLYPAGQGTGNLRRITAWTNLAQVQSIGVSGGDQNFVNTTTVSNTQQTQIPSDVSPIAIEMSLFDDPALSFFPLIRTITENRTPTALRVIVPGGNRTVANAYWSLRDMPNLASGAAVTVPLRLTLTNKETKYAT